MFRVGFKTSGSLFMGTQSTTTTLRHITKLYAATSILTYVGLYGRNRTVYNTYILSYCNTHSHDVYNIKRSYETYSTALQRLRLTLL
jgi:hypothetical protein